MGSILELRTNLRSLRSEEFTGRKPYVSTTLPADFNASSPKTPNTLELAAEARQDDASRLVQLLKDRPGLTYIAKQGLLSYSESGKAGKALADVAATVTTLITQATLSGTGFHGSADITTGNTYYPGFTSFLGSKFIGNDSIVGVGSTTAREVDRRSTSLSSSYSSALDSYYEISGSKYIGSVNNKALESDTGRNSKLPRTSGRGVTGDNLRLQAYSTLNPAPLTDISALKVNRGTFDNNVVVRLDGNKYSRSDQTTNELNTKTREYLSLGSTVVLKMSQAGVSGSYDQVQGRDQLNYLIYSGSSDPENQANDDLINFKIVVFEPGNSNQYYLYFRAYLETFGDSFNGEWNGTNYIGRAESIFNYTGFKRDINLGFKMAASSESELIPLYKKLNRLAGTTAPSYSDTFMRGVFVKLTVGDYLKDVPGFFNSVNLTWDKNYPWETSLGKKKETTPQLPHILDVSTTFTPIHDFTPAYAESFISGIEKLNVE